MKNKRTNSQFSFITPPKDPILGHLTGHILQLRKGRLKLMQGSVDKYGPFIKYKYLHKNVFLIAHPSGVQAILQKNAHLFSKMTPGFKKIKEFAGDGTLVSEGEQWKKLRTLIQPYFIQNKRTNYYHEIFKEMERSILEINTKTLCINNIMGELTLRAIGCTIFEKDFKEDAKFINKQIKTLFDITNEKITRFLPIPTRKKLKNNRDFKHAKENLHNYVDNLLSENKGLSKKNIITYLLEKENITAKDLKDEIITLLIAGTETTSSSLVWAFYILAKNPDLQDRISKEATLIFNKKSDFNSLSLFKETENIIKETLRMYPGFWMLARIAKENFNFFGTIIPKTSIVLLPPLLIHTHKDYWDNPTDFKPERFKNLNEKTFNKYSYLPFGYGPRACIGANFSMMEMKIILGLFCKKFRFSLKTEKDIEIDANISLRPNHDIIIDLESRT